MQESQNAAPPDRLNKKRRLKLSDILITVIVLALIIFLLRMLMQQLNLRHEVNTARATTDKLITAMQEQNAAAAQKLGDADFRAQHNTSQLSYLFDQSKAFTKGTPTIVKQTVNDGKVNHVVSVYYKFADKKPFYVRVTAYERNHTSTWYIINFSGNESLSALTK